MKVKQKMSNKYEGFLELNYWINVNLIQKSKKKMRAKLKFMCYWLWENGDVTSFLLKAWKCILKYIRLDERQLKLRRESNHRKLENSFSFLVKGAVESRVRIIFVCLTFSFCIVLQGCGNKTWLDFLQITFEGEKLFS